MRQADAAIVPAANRRQRISARTKYAKIVARASAPEISKLDSAAGRFAKQFVALRETRRAPFTNYSAQFVGAIASNPAISIFEIAARAVAANSKAIEFARTRTGFGARLFDYDGRGERKSFARCQEN